VKLEDDDFALFGLPGAFALDRAELDARWRALQAQVHPDRFASEGAAAQRVAMQWAMRVNEAYRRLRDPLSRAAYLCGLRGVPVQGEGSAAMPPGFLVQQMEWRERLEQAEGASALRALDDEAAASEREAFEQLALKLDGTTGASGGAAEAAALVRALMFTRRLREDLARRLEPFDA
jgi:molecular chaperone HscB